MSVNPEYIEIPKPDPGTKFLKLIEGHNMVDRLESASNNPCEGWE